MYLKKTKNPPQEKWIYCDDAKVDQIYTSSTDSNKEIVTNPTVFMKVGSRRNIKK